MGFLKQKIIVPKFEEPRGLSKIFRNKATEEVAPGDRPPVRAKGEKVTANELRNLRELMRQRYALDLQIWDFRKVGDYNRALVEDMMKKADALLLKIRGIVLSMDNRDYFKTDAEYQKLIQVKIRVMAPGSREWVRNPPWDED